MKFIPTVGNCVRIIRSLRNESKTVHSSRHVLLYNSIIDLSLEVFIYV